MIIRINLEPICLRKDTMPLRDATRTTTDVLHTPKSPLPRQCNIFGQILRKSYSVYFLIFYCFNFPCIWWLDYWSSALRIHSIKATPKGRRYPSDMTIWQFELPTTLVKVIRLILKTYWNFSAVCLITLYSFTGPKSFRLLQGIT